MADEQNLTPEQKAQMELKIEGKYFTRSIGLMLFPVLLAFASRAFFFLYPQAACKLTENPLVFSLWPQNSLLQELIDAGDYSAQGECMFLAMHSIVSVGCMLWLIVYVLIEFRRKDRIFTIGLLKIGLIGAAATTFDLITTSFQNEKSLFSLSYLQSIEVNMWKSLVVIMAAFFSAGTLIGRIFAYRRSISSRTGRGFDHA